MPTESIIQGRRVSAPELAAIQRLLDDHPSWHRTRLSRELCRLWGWHNELGQLKDMACRTLLLKLEARGQIRLPARQSVSANGSRNRHPVAAPHDATALVARLEDLRPLRVEPIPAAHPHAPLFQFLLHRHHYLSLHNSVGENLKYLVCERHGRPLAALLFGSAAWKCRARDHFIGWSDQARQQQLRGLANNTRFLILPWVQVAHLASHILSLIARRLSGDWQARYGHPIHLVESFVERGRFAGTCYRAAGWLHAGATTGRGRNSPTSLPQGPVKEIWLKPLQSHFRGALTA